MNQELYDKIRHEIKWSYDHEDLAEIMETLLIGLRECLNEIKTLRND